MMVSLRSSVPRADALIRDRFGAYLAEGFDRPAHLSISIVPAHKPSGSSIPQRLTWIRSRPMHGDISQGCLRFTDGASTAVVDYGAGNATLSLRPETLEDAVFFSRTFFPLALMELLRTVGFYYLHGALCSKGDSSALFLGSGGTGKSTAAAALLTRGWRIVGDDSLLLRSSQGKSALLFPFEPEISLSAEAFNQTGLAGGTVERGKIRIALSDLPADRRCAFSSPTSVILLLPEEIPDPFIPATRSDLLGRLIEDNPLIMAVSDLASDHLCALKTLLRLTHCRALRPPFESPLDLRRWGELLETTAVGEVDGLFRRGVASRR